MQYQTEQPAPPLFAQPVPRFDGKTYDHALDGVRLTGNLAAIFALMKDGQWRTVSEVREGAGLGEGTEVTARFRDFRKKKFGGHVVDRRRRGEAKAGLFEYRVIVDGVRK